MAKKSKFEELLQTVKQDVVEQKFHHEAGATQDRLRESQGSRSQGAEVFMPSV